MGPKQWRCPEEKVDSLHAAGQGKLDVSRVAAHMSEDSGAQAQTGNCLQVALGSWRRRGGSHLDGFDAECVQSPGNPDARGTTPPDGRVLLSFPKRAVYNLDRLDSSHGFHLRARPAMLKERPDEWRVFYRR
jgi:hypothetical protein